MGMPRNRQETEIRERKIRIGVVTSCAVLGLLGIIACGYGHAALSSDLMISGEATIVATEGTPKWDVDYMQDMTPAICRAAEVGTTSQLIDKRDNKPYWVEKLADGNCWMTQNLALVLTTEGLTSELSDLQASSASAAKYSTTTNANGVIIYVWNANSKYPPRDSTLAPISSSATTGNYVSAKSTYGGADYIITTPTQYYTKYELNTISSFSGIKQVSASDGWQPTLSYVETGKVYDEATKTYDSHFLIGAHYQIGAATAGSSTSGTAPANPASSICPKGWKLPSKSSNSDDDLVKLVKQYGFTSKTVTSSGNMSLPPLYFIRSGGSSGSKFNSIGTNGSWTTSRTNSQAYTNVMSISNETLNTTSSVARSSGRSVRCLLRL